MRVYCKISGVSFLAEGFSHKTNVYGIHPIFACEQKQLVNMAKNWAEGSLRGNEPKLLFLALLNSLTELDTGKKLIEFRVTANPSPATISINMEKLLQFINWQSQIQSAQLKLPRIAVTKEDSSLVNVTNWLKQWNTIRQEWEEGKLTREKRASLRLKEEALTRVIHSAADSENYAARLAKWAMEAADVPANLQEYWTELFALKGTPLFEARGVDLEELREHMEQHLPVWASPVFSHKVLYHVRRLEERNKAGIGFWLGLAITDEEVAERQSLKQLTAFSFRIISEEDEIETSNREAAIANYAPTEEPKKIHYKNPTDYIRARAAWLLASNSSSNSSSSSTKKESEE